MYVEDRSRLKRILVDTLGVLLIVAAGLTGWLPGPGGIPLLIIGLSLLATNHEWAERVMLSLKSHGSKLANQIFDGSPAAKWAVDILAIALIGAVVFIVTHLTGSIRTTATISLGFLSAYLLSSNRKRLTHLRSKLKKP